MFIGRRNAEERNRFLFHEQAKLEGFADQIEIDMRNLDAALRDGLDQPLGLEARHEFADGSKRHTGHCNQLALRHELPRIDITGQKMLREARIGLLSQSYRLVTIIHARPPELAFPQYYAAAATNKRSKMPVSRL